jgi:uncharacterized membrane protein YbaN (DUF454 family)
MESDFSEGTVHPDSLEPGQGDGAFPRLDIEFDERAGSIRVYDPRLFQAGKRAFCKRLLKAATSQSGISRAEIDLASASCQIEFSPRSHTPRSMADSFVRAVREASAGSTLTERIGWWRRRGGWSAMTAFRLPDGVSLWETFEVEPAQIRHRRPGLRGDRAWLSRLADTLADVEGVEACHISPWLRRISLDVCTDSPLSDRVLDTVEQALARLEATESLRTEPPAHALFTGGDGEVVVANGGKRLLYLALAGGSFAMTLVAVFVPGIPTVPCLLATSYFLTRSSPRLNERLRRTEVFGPILGEWERNRALSWSSKGKLIGLTVSIVLVSIALTPLSPIALVLILLISSASIHGIATIPVLAEEPRARPRLNGRLGGLYPMPYNGA